MTAAAPTAAAPTTAVVEAAVEAAAEATAPLVVAADWELDELIEKVAAGMTAIDWARLAFASAADLATGARDPLKRRGVGKRRRGGEGGGGGSGEPGEKGDEDEDEWESMDAWADRRRNVATSRASRAFAEARCPALERVLVGKRNGAFVAAAREGARAAVRAAVRAAAAAANDEGRNDGEAAAAAVRRRVVVCVGLAHLDGVAAAL